MIRIFYGDDRKAVQAEAERLLGKEHETLEAETLTPADLVSLFQGVSLFGDQKRRILVKNLDENKDCWVKLAEFTATEHEVVVWNVGLDKRSAVYKELLKQSAVEFREFKLPDDPDDMAVFAVFDALVKGDTATVLKTVARIEEKDDANRFLATLATLTCKRLTAYQNATARARTIVAVKALAQADLDIKQSRVAEPWTAVKIALVKIAERQKTGVRR